MNPSRAFFDVDTQMDFMLPSGSLYVRGAEEIIPNLQKLMTYAQTHGIPILSSADAHPPDDPSFAEWPPHCVVGTPGQQRIPETRLLDACVVANQPGAFKSLSPWPAQVIIEKQEYDALTNVNCNAILDVLGKRRYVVFGVATDYCVRGTVLGLLKRGCSVDLVTDAIRAITEQRGQQAVAEMVSAGARLITRAEACS